MNTLKPLKFVSLRKPLGSVSAIMLIATSMLIGLSVCAFQLEIFMLRKQKCQHACESAAVEAAQCLSQIMIEDANFGYLSLSDFPALSSFTKSPDNEPLPVASINSCISAARLEQLLAEELDKDDLRLAAEHDRLEVLNSGKKLEAHLAAACREENQSFHDFTGKTVLPYKRARDLFCANMPELRSARTRLSKFKISLGWLKDGSSTMHYLPERAQLIPLSKDDFLKSFKDLPVAGKSYYLAGTSEQSRLVSAERFVAADGKHVSSAILIETCTDFLDDSGKLAYSIEAKAAALPYAHTDRSAPGSLVIYFPQGTVSTWTNLRSILKDRCLESIRISPKTASKGDFPVDPQAELIAGEDETLSRFLCRAIQDWISTNHGRSSLEALRKALDLPFSSVQQAFDSPLALIYDFDATGNCTVKTMSDCGFLTHTVSEAQQFGIAYDLKSTEKGQLCLSIRNMVSARGIVNGGKHCGQPIPGELPASYSSPASIMGENAGKDINPGNFRKSYLRGGLAVALEIFLK